MDAQAFIDAIVDDPDDRAMWIAYADWLCDRGELRGELINLALAADDHEDPERVRARVDMLTGRTRELLSPPVAKAAQHWRFKWWRGFIRAAALITSRDDLGDALVDALLADPHAPLIETLDVGTHWRPVLRHERRRLRSLSVYNLGRGAADLDARAPGLEDLELSAGHPDFYVDELVHGALRRLSMFAECPAIETGAFQLPRLEALAIGIAANRPILTSETSILRRPPPTLTSLRLQSAFSEWVPAFSRCGVVAQLTQLTIGTLGAAGVDALCEHAAAFAHIAALHIDLVSSVNLELVPPDQLRELHERLRRAFPQVTIAPDRDRR